MMRFPENVWCLFMELSNFTSIRLLVLSSDITAKELYNLMMKKVIDPNNREHVDVNGNPRISGFIKIQKDDSSITSYMIYMKKVGSFQRIKITAPEEFTMQKEELKIPAMAVLRLRLSKLGRWFIEISPSYDSTAVATLRSLLESSAGKFARIKFCNEMIDFIHNNLKVTNIREKNLLAPDGTTEVLYATAMTADASKTNADKYYYDPQYVVNFEVYAKTSRNIDIPVILRRDGRVRIKGLDQLDSEETSDLVVKVLNEIEEMYEEICINKRRDYQVKNFVLK